MVFTKYGIGTLGGKGALACILRGRVRFTNTLRMNYLEGVCACWVAYREQRNVPWQHFHLHCIIEKIRLDSIRHEKSPHHTI